MDIFLLEPKSWLWLEQFQFVKPCRILWYYLCLIFANMSNNFPIYFPQLSLGFCSCQFWLYFENMFEVFFLFCHSTVICPKKSKMILAISRWKVNSYLLSNMDIYRLHPPCCYLVAYLLNWLCNTKLCSQN